MSPTQETPPAPGPHHERPGRLVGAVTGRRTAWLFALIPLVLAVLAMGALGEGERDRLSTDQLPAGLDSTQGTELRERLPESDSQVAVVLFTADEGELSEEALGELEQVAGDVGAVAAGDESGSTTGGSGSAGQDTGQGSGSPSGEAAGGPPLLTPAEDGTAAIAIVPVDASTSSATADAVTELRDRVDDAVPDGVTGQVTGPAAIQADLAEVFQGADLTLLLVTASVVALLLVLTYRSPVLWIVPLTVVGIADRFAAVAATQVMALLDVAWDESTVGILSVLVFGAGTDYALLLISRYRDELRTTESRHLAMATALRRTAEAVLASATTVVLGVLTLLLSLTPSTRGLGVASAIGIVVAAAFVLLVLPAALVLFGRWVFWPRVPHVGETALVDSDTLWHRVGGWVAKRPGAFVAGTLVALAVLAIGVFRIDTGLDTDDQFLDEPEAITASQRLEKSFPVGFSDPTQIITAADAQQVLGVVKDVDGVTSARISNEGEGVAQIDAVIDAEPGSSSAQDTIGGLRDALSDFDDTHVTGTEAEALDEADAASRDRTVILPLILALVLGALLLLLRAVVAPVLLVLTVLATYAASLGVSWWIFTGPLGFEALDSGAPLMAFLFLVALGVDYNIFLVTRAREESAAHGTRTGMLRGLSATGGVITSAGILLAAVFLVLGVLPLVVLAQLGVIVCIGVLLDTLVVRTVLVPALALLLGDRFWWPGRLSRPRGADPEGAGVR
ncbi:MMPL family transporter [Nocardioides ferulae]|uniref:MMPL family transporter n=1 Tax=Nocardioides ferulae TaxID=2340821 RepID=UPI000EB195BF|nr:MMPL family transporter [Nocardioides ferulae]